MKIQVIKIISPSLEYVRESSTGISIAVSVMLKFPPLYLVDPKLRAANLPHVLNRNTPVVIIAAVVRQQIRVPQQLAKARMGKDQMPMIERIQLKAMISLVTPLSK